MLMNKFKPKDRVRIKHSRLNRRRFYLAATRKGSYGIVLEYLRNGGGVCYIVDWYDKNNKIISFLQGIVLNENVLMLRKRYVKHHPLTNIFKDKRLTSK